MFPVELDRLYI